jgi:aminoacyl tRNA synthase complex-interacting multifunctional protein 1
MAYLSDEAMAALDAHLTPRTFLAGGAAPSLADLVLAAHLGDAVSRFPAAQVGAFPAIARWYDHLVSTAPRGAGGEGLLPAGKLDRPPLVLAVPVVGGGGGGGAAAAADKKADKKKGGDAAKADGGAAKDGGAKAAAPEAATGAAAAAGAAAATAPAAAPKKAKAKAGKDGPQGGAAPAAAAAPSTSSASSPEDAAIAGLDFRVGTIVAADKHPNADSLYVEQIDLGEAEGPRTIVSGLAKYCTLDSLRGRRVVVVANLKPAKMRDVLSAGMVLCASAGEVCAPIEPPAGAAPGERVLFGDLTPGPPEPVHKKVGKLFDAAAPHLKVGDDGVCRFKDVPFGTGAGPVTSGVPGGMIK